MDSRLSTLTVAFLGESCVQGLFFGCSHTKRTVLLTGGGQFDTKYRFYLRYIDDHIHQARAQMRGHIFLLVVPRHDPAQATADARQAGITALTSNLPNREKPIIFTLHFRVSEPELFD
jgi:hypothetical protein